MKISSRGHRLLIYIVKRNTKTDGIGLFKYSTGYLWENDGESDGVVIQALFGQLTSNVTAYLNDTVTYEINSYNDVRQAQIIGKRNVWKMWLTKSWLAGITLSILS